MLFRSDYKAHDHIKITPWEREINHIATSMSPQPRGWTTPLSSWRRWRNRRRSWRPRRQRPAGVFPLQSTAPILCFGVSTALSSGKRRGTIFIVVFRSRRSRGRKDQRQRSHEAPEGGPHAAKESGRVGPPNLGLVAPLPSILLPEASF